MARRLAVVFVLTLAGCAGLEGPATSDVRAYCTPDNAYRLGSQSKAYFGNCPKDSEGAFLAGLQRGRAVRPNPPQAYPYFEKMEQTEKQLLAAASDADRERLRGQLRDIEWWAVHIVNSPGTYSVDN
jgi:hypothetical protein